MRPEQLELVVDVGNTETVVGLFGPSELSPQLHWRYSTAVPRTPDELALLLRSFLREAGVDPDRVVRSVVGSVVPAQTELLRRTLDRLGEGVVQLVDPGVPLPIRLEVEEPRSVGADRIVNTLAARVLFGRNTIVVDMGTATTYDCISAEGVFLGGVIAPGLQAGQEWLGGRTAKLPRVEFRPPARVIGTRTEACLQSGIFYAAVDAMDGIVDRIRREWDRSDVLVVATGGFASQVAPHSRTIHEVAPFLTLTGLVLAGRYMADPAASGLPSSPDPTSPEPMSASTGASLPGPDDKHPETFGSVS